MKHVTLLTRLITITALTATTCLNLFCLPGCNRSDDGLSTEQRQTGDRLSEIAKKADGDWNKVSGEDRDFVLKLSHGNEQSARMMIIGAAGKVAGKPGGPPRK